MGNDKRNAADAGARSNYLEAKKQAELAAKSKEKKKGILAGVCVILAIVLMIGVITYKNLAESGYLLRREVAAQSDNFEVDGAMMAYFFNNQYQQYSSYVSYFGIDTSKSLKVQDSVFGGTWFDYFMGVTTDFVGELLSLCEAAKAAGVTLDDEDMASVDSSINQLKTYATLYGYSFDQYLIMTTGSGVKEKDVRNALELNALATKYANEYQESLTYTKEECEAYYAENVDSFVSVDLLKFDVPSADFAEKDEEGKPTGDMEAARQAAEEYARKIAGASDVDTFKALVKEYIVNVEGEEEDHAEEHLEDLLYEDVLKTTTAHKEPVIEWAFSAEAGEKKIFSEDSSDGNETTYNVYYLVSAAGRDETLTRDIRHILLLAENYANEEDAKIEAEAIYAEWEAAGFSEEKFLELNTEYNDDPGSVDNGGLYEKVAPGDMVEEFDTWLFDSARTAGDHGLVESADYGWHIMNYVGESDVPVWQKVAEQSLSTKDYEAMVDKYEASVVFNNDVLGHIAA